MIKSQKIGKLLVMFLSIGILFSCSDDDNVTPFDFIGDVYVTKRLINGEAKLANSYFAYGNQAMTFAQATAPDGTEIGLSATNTDGYTFGKAATTPDFTLDIPEEGNYTFDVLHEDIQHQAIDLLVFEDLDFTTISSATMETARLVVEWDENPDAQLYMLRLINEDGEVVFGSPTLPSTAVLFKIEEDGSSGTWDSNYPNLGDIYTLELHAFVFDEEATDSDYSFNIQEISISEETVVWNY